MFSKIRNVLSGSSSDDNRNYSPAGRTCLSPKFPYSRPHFLALSEEQVQASADHRSRPIITPNHGMSFFTGYGECINAGKSKWNEDQAVSHHGVLKSGNFVMSYKFYALFDGHAGVGASICAANQMHHVVHERLVDTQDDIWKDYLDTADPQRRNCLVIGALEAAFKDMDDIIRDDRATLQSSGGCTAIVSIFLLGQLYVANAGDSRAIVCRGFGFEALSTDFTPESDKSRIRQLAQTKPELLGNDFTYMEYIRQPRVNDLGKRILYRDAFMTGWAHKTIVPEDLKISIISGQGKRSRVMGTIGVTRGFGDHELVSVHQKVPIKPFLSCHPEVKVYDLKNCSNYDVLIMGTDGLWDVVDGHMVTQIVNYAVDNFPRKEMCPTAAACLVGAARGSLKENCWMMKSGKLASVDDISVFVIPLYPCSHLTYKLRKQIATEAESDCTLVGNATDNTLKDDISDDTPVGSTSSLDSASSDDYSLLLQSRVHVSSVKISGISFVERRKSEIVLQEVNECEDEELEEIEEHSSTDLDIEDVEPDENAAMSNRSSDKTVLIAKSYDDGRSLTTRPPAMESTDAFVLRDVGKFSASSSETPAVSYTTEATSRAHHVRTELSDESSGDELTAPDQRPRARRIKQDFLSTMKEKQAQRGIHNVPFERFQSILETSNNTISTDSSLKQPDISAESIDYKTVEAQGDATATLESQRLQREYQYQSGRYTVGDTHGLRGQYDIQQATATEAFISRKQALSPNTGSSSPVSAHFLKKDDSSSEVISEDVIGGENQSISSEDIVPDSDIDLLQTQTVERFVKFQQGATRSQSPESICRNQHRTSRLSEYERMVAENEAAERERMRENEYLRTVKFLERRTPQTRVTPRSSEYTQSHESMDTEGSAEEMRESQMLSYQHRQDKLKHERYVKSHLMPPRKISPLPARLFASRGRTNSYPPCEMAEPDRQELASTSGMPPVLGPVQELLRAQQMQQSGDVKPVPRAKRKPQHPPKGNVEAKWEFYSDDETEKNPRK